MALLAFVEKTRALLALEREAELEQSGINNSKLTLNELRLKGTCLLNLAIKSLSTGLSGRRIVEFCHRSGDTLPAHSLSAGDIVVLTVGKGTRPDKTHLSGTVYRVTDNDIKLALDESEEFREGEAFNLFKAPNDVTYTRYKQGLDEMATGGLL